MLHRIGVNNSSDFVAGNPKYFYESDYMNELMYGYENSSSEERAKLNDFMTANDGVQIETYPCARLSTETGNEIRCVSVSPF